MSTTTVSACRPATLPQSGVLAGDGVLMSGPVTRADSARDRPQTDVLAAYPQMWPLVAMADPHWRLYPSADSVLDGYRVCLPYAETLCVCHAGIAAAVWGPASTSPGRVPNEVYYRGPIDGAVQLLQSRADPPPADRSLSSDLLPRHLVIHGREAGGRPAVQG